MSHQTSVLRLFKAFSGQAVVEAPSGNSRVADSPITVRSPFLRKERIFS